MAWISVLPQAESKKANAEMKERTPLVFRCKAETDGSRVSVFLIVPNTLEKEEHLALRLLGAFVLKGHEECSFEKENEQILVQVFQNKPLQSGTWLSFLFFFSPKRRKA